MQPRQHHSSNDEGVLGERCESNLDRRAINSSSRTCVFGAHTRPRECSAFGRLRPRSGLLYLQPGHHLWCSRRVVGRLAHNGSRRGGTRPTSCFRLWIDRRGQHAIGFADRPSSGQRRSSRQVRIGRPTIWRQWASQLRNLQLV